ncbi:hypothetical protein LTR37_016713 [Vermiconidia calcicola]|uniref:Uncharacterized protein n=1 Tax=Vermiconidia calcicola TaxID=1690605 RepID=A0ACC3MMS6_9PEZI|nr:hypothetical protein LTR37_016713 [Vermiconidia calcicola]
MIIAHTVFATVGIRPALSNRWHSHSSWLFSRPVACSGVFQLIAYLFYIAAFAMGIDMAALGRMTHEAHPIIGIVIFVLVFFQPFLGFIHHFAFKKRNRRVVWSHGRIWLGRIVITLGTINGGLGLELAKRVAYGESKRPKANAAVDQEPSQYKWDKGSISDVQYH